MTSRKPITRPRKWSEEKEKKFLELAGKVDDKKVAAEVGVCHKWIKRIRESYNIPRWSNRKYTDEQMEYVRKHYKEQSVGEMISTLAVMYPETTFTNDGIKDRMRQMGLIRTLEESNNIRSRESKREIAKERFKKISEACRRHRPGDVYWCNSAKQWLIIMPNFKRKFYKVYIWEQHNPPLDRGHYIRIKDSTKAITIDNIELVKKTGTTEGIRLTDNWVLGTIICRKTPEQRATFLNTPKEFIGAEISKQRLKIQLIREIKSLINENHQLASPPSPDEKELL